MLEKVANWFGGNWGVFTLVFLWLLLVLTNFKPGTWLSGWDNLHSEFNVGLNLARAFSPAWQEYQGLGLLGGMGHGADLIRVVVIALVSIFVDTSLIRYTLTFACLLIGVLGMYSLAGFLSQLKERKIAHLVSFSSGLFYLLNIGTIQNFYAPFEPFYWMYAFFPWLLLFLFRYLHRPTVKRLFLFSIISLLASPMGYLQTAFLVSSLIIGCILITYCFSKENNFSIKHKLSHVLAVISVIFATDAFWFLPVAYFTITDSNVTINAQMNQIATPEVYLSNQGYGDVWDVLRLHGYWMNLHDYEKEQPTYLMETWNAYTNNPVIQLFSVLTVVLIGVGVWYAYRHKLGHYQLLILPFILILFVLIGENPPSGLLMTGLREVIPLVKQIFRSPFTKWIVPASALYSLMFGLGVAGLLEIAKSKAKEQFPRPMLMVWVVSCVLVIIPAVPAFTGNFIYSRMRVTLPGEYLELFEFFKTQPLDQRVMTLPAHTFWGWNFYDWGGRGSGFLWYGIEQPILDRAFDVWSRNNESFYKEFYSALYGQDKERLAQVIDKYEVGYAVLDESVVTADKSYSSLNFENTKVLLTQIGGQITWQEGKLYVYDLRKINPQVHFVNSPQNIVTTTLDTTYGKYDPLFADNNYLLKDGPDTTSFPFSNLYNNNIDFVTYQTDQVVFTKKVAVQQPQILTVPGLIKNTVYTGVAVIKLTNNQLQISFEPIWQISIDSSTHTSPTLAPVSVDLPSDVKKIYLDLNGQFTELEQDKPIKVQLRNLVVGKSWSIGIVDPAKSVTEGNEIIVNPEDAITVQQGEETWDTLTESQNFKVPAGQIELVASTPSQALFIDMRRSEYDLSEYGCDIFNRGSYEKHILEETVLYKAYKQGASCEGRDLADITTAESHLVRVAGLSRRGRPLKMYLTNEMESRADFEFLLPSGEFDITYPVMSWPWAAVRPFAINFENKSFGNEVAENVIKLVEVRTVPMEVIAGIKLSPQVKSVMTNDLSVQSYSKYFTYGYDVKAVSNGPSNIVSLNQGYDPGWLAFPGLQFWKQYEHVKYNGWANGWILTSTSYEDDSGSGKPETSDGEAQPLQITILYWPQLLSFAGYGLLILTLVWLGFLTIKDMLNPANKISKQKPVQNPDFRMKMKRRFFGNE